MKIVRFIILVLFLITSCSPRYFLAIHEDHSGYLISSNAEFSILVKRQKDVPKGVQISEGWVNVDFRSDPLGDDFFFVKDSDVEFLDKERGAIKVKDKATLYHIPGNIGPNISRDVLVSCELFRVKSNSQSGSKELVVLPVKVRLVKSKDLKARDVQDLRITFEAV